MPKKEKEIEDLVELKERLAAADEETSSDIFSEALHTIRTLEVAFIYNQERIEELEQKVEQLELEKGKLGVENFKLEEKIIDMLEDPQV